MHLQYMTTLTNIEILAQLGWTMELMHNSTGGRLPRFWRPPYGDTDIRVHAIAKEIFGLTGILWNQEYVYVLSVMHRKFIPRLLSTGDWMLPTGTTLGKINASMTKWLTGKYLQLRFFWRPANLFALRHRPQEPWSHHPRTRAHQPKC